MFDTLIRFFQVYLTAFWDNTLNWIAGLWDVFGKSFSTWFSAAVVLFGWVLWSFSFMGELLTVTFARLTKIAELVANLDVGTVTGNDYFVTANTFFPVAELFACLILYATCASLVFVVRVVLQLYKLIPFKSA